MLDVNIGAGVVEKETGSDVIIISVSSKPIMFGTVGFVSKKRLQKHIYNGIISIPFRVTTFPLNRK